MRAVIIESPYAGDVEANLEYLHECILDCIMRDESPYASHLMLTTALDDRNPDLRQLGIDAGFAWRNVLCHAPHWPSATVVYIDRGTSPGMRLGIEHAKSLGHVTEYRSIR